MRSSEHSEEQLYTIYVRYEPRPVYFNQTPIYFQFRRKVGIKESHTFSQLKGCLRRVGQKFYKEELELKKEERGIKKVTEPKPDDIFKLFDIVAYKVKNRHVTDTTFEAWLQGLTQEKTGFNLLQIKEREPNQPQDKQQENHEETCEQGVPKNQQIQQDMEEPQQNQYNIYLPESAASFKDLQSMIPNIQTSSLQIDSDFAPIQYQASKFFRFNNGVLDGQDLNLLQGLGLTHLYRPPA